MVVVLFEEALLEQEVLEVLELVGTVLEVLEEEVVVVVGGVVEDLGANVALTFSTSSNKWELCNISTEDFIWTGPSPDLWSIELLMGIPVQNRSLWMKAALEQQLERYEIQHSEVR